MHDQAEDRCHRIGQHDAVTAWYLLAANTIDETMIELIARKRGIVGAVTDGRTRRQRGLVDAVVRELRSASRSSGCARWPEQVPREGDPAVRQPEHAVPRDGRGGMARGGRRRLRVGEVERTAPGSGSTTTERREAAGAAEGEHPLALLDEVDSPSSSGSSGTISQGRGLAIALDPPRRTREAVDEHERAAAHHPEPVAVERERRATRSVVRRARRCRTPAGSAAGPGCPGPLAAHPAGQSAPGPACRGRCGAADAALPLPHVAR